MSVREFLRALAIGTVVGAVVGPLAGTLQFLVLRALVGG